MIDYSSLPDITIEEFMMQNGIQAKTSPTHSLRDFCKYCTEGRSLIAWATKNNVNEPEKFITEILYPYLENQGAFRYSIKDSIRSSFINPPSLALREIYSENEKRNWEERFKDMTIEELGKFYFFNNGTPLNGKELRCPKMINNILQYYDYVKKCDDMPEKLFNNIEKTLVKYHIISLPEQPPVQNETSTIHPIDEDEDFSNLE